MKHTKIECLFGLHDLEWKYITTHEIMGFTEVYHFTQICKTCKRTLYVNPLSLVDKHNTIIECKRRNGETIND